MLTSEYFESLIEESRAKQQGIMFNKQLVAELTDALEALLNG